MLTFFWVCIECKSWNTRSTWFMQFVHSPLFSLFLPLSLINQSKCDNCTDLWRTGKITSTQTTNKIGAKKQKILLYCFLQFFVWQNPMRFFLFVCFFYLLFPITNIFSFKTAGNREVSYVFFVTFVTEKSGAIRPGCFGWRPCHPSWRPGGKWLM